MNDLATPMGAEEIKSDVPAANQAAPVATPVEGATASVEGEATEAKSEEMGATAVKAEGEMEAPVEGSQDSSAN